LLKEAVITSSLSAFAAKQDANELAEYSAKAYG
jgi:hypothetical protein